MKAFFEKHEADDHFDNDELVVRLVDLRESLRNEYSVGRLSTNNLLMLSNKKNTNLPLGCVMNCHAVT